MDARFEEKTSRSSLGLLYNISRELTAALDLRTVLQRVLKLSMSNIGATNGSIIVLDESGNPIDSIIIVGEQLIENTTEQLRVTLDQGLAGWVIRHSQGVLIADTSKDERWLRRPDDDISRTGPKSAMSVPLMARDHLAGVMTLVHPEPNSFNQEHFELLQAIADQAAITLLNARLYDESRRRARVMTALVECAAVINASLDLDEVLQRILEHIGRALRVEVVSLALINPDGRSLTFLASSAGTENQIIGQRLEMGQGIAGWVAQEGQGIIISDVSADARFAPLFDEATGFHTKSIACAPLRSRGRIIGILEALNPLEGKFDLDALEVLTGIGSLAGTALENARLYEQVQAVQRRYLELFQDSIDPILITDFSGAILEANRQAEITTGFERLELHGKNIGDLHAIDFDQLGENFSLLNDKETISYETELQTRQGVQIPVEVYVRVASFEGETNIQWIIRDISERKNLERLRNDLISMIYHDLRSPLGNIVSSLDVFSAMLPDESDPAFRSLIDIALRSTERIQRLTDSLLDMNRLESGHPIINSFAVSPLLLARDAFEAVSPIAENKQQKITISIPVDIPPIMVDADMIRRVLINLLENAVKYSPPGGEIELGARVELPSVFIWVRDSGPGISPEDQARIFEKYTRLERDNAIKGFGLGLAYCRLAVEGHGGRIWVESEVGKGARFCLTLPMARN